MESLTKVEEKIMQILWKLKKGFVKDIIEQIDDEPKPPYNTISSVVRILVKKGFVKFKAYGKTYEYSPAITKLAYKKFMFKQFMKNYFDGSYENVVSFMVNDEKISDEEMKEIQEIIEKNKNN